MAAPIARIERALGAKLRMLQNPGALFDVPAKPNPNAGRELFDLLRHRERKLRR